MKLRSPPRAAAPLLLALAACGGTIEFGVDRGDSGITPTPSPDAAVTPARDASVLTDAGACTPRTRPPVPATWPFPMTSAAYLNDFANVIPQGAIPCSSAACHGGVQAPYIADAAALATPANVTRAISELWTRARPPVGGGVSTLRRKHDPNGDNAAPPYTPQQVTAIQAFLDRAYDCAWKAAPAPMAGECPAPDVSYCDQ